MQTNHTPRPSRNSVRAHTSYHLLTQYLDVMSVELTRRAADPVGVALSMFESYYVFLEGDYPGKIWEPVFMEDFLELYGEPQRDERSRDRGRNVLLSEEFGEGQAAICARIPNGPTLASR